MSFGRTVPFVLAGALALAMAAGCGDNDSPTGNGGTSSNTLSIPAGTYAASGAMFVCGESVPFDALVDTVAYCSNEIVNDFFGFSCPIKRTGNNLSLFCQETRSVGIDCEETVTVSFKGIVSGDRYELWGTFEYSDNPANCWDGSYCDSLHLTFDRLGAVPSACAYADENTVELNVVGGPQAGAHVLDAFGSASESVGSFAYNIGASSGGIVATPSSLAGGATESIYMNVQTTYIDPATLPATLPVVIIPGGASAAPAVGGPEATLYYSEYSSTYQFIADAATSGSFVVNEIDGDHIAGRFNTVITGTEYSEANPGGVPAQRTLSGGYFVTSSTMGPVANATTGSSEGLAARLRSLLH
jgi:hypothetical protein